MHEFGQLVQPPFQLVGGQRGSLSDRCGLHVQRKVDGLLGRQQAGSMCAGQAGQRGQQRPVVLQRLGHFIVEALMVLMLDTVGAELNSFSDEQPGAGRAVVVAEQYSRYGDGKSGSA